MKRLKGTLGLRVCFFRFDSMSAIFSFSQVCKNYTRILNRGNKYRIMIVHKCRLFYIFSQSGTQVQILIYIQQDKERLDYRNNMIIVHLMRTLHPKYNNNSNNNNNNNISRLYGHNFCIFQKNIENNINNTS